MSEKRFRSLDEICAVGNLEEYRETLNDLLHIIIKNGCTISTRYDVEYSNIEESIENGSHIRISLNVKEPLAIIWKLLHEYGHFLSGKRQVNDLTLEREELAWKYAAGFLCNYPDLLKQQRSFFKCQEECLKSYRSFL